MLKLLHRDNRGDTIVEVMIVLAVLGLALGISYATANRSLLNARQAQENSTASEIAQSQIEGLRSLTSSPFKEIFLLDEPFCTIRNPDAGDREHPYGALPIRYGDCARIRDGGVTYNVSITRGNADDDRNTFTIKISWPDVNGEGDDTVTLAYKAHPDAPNL